MWETQGVIRTEVCTNSAQRKSSLHTWKAEGAAGKNGSNYKASAFSSKESELSLVSCFPKVYKCLLQFQMYDMEKSEQQ